MIRISKSWLSATPTAMLFSQAFKNPPKLKRVAPPVIKNQGIDPNKNQCQTTQVVAPPMNSVQGNDL